MAIKTLKTDNLTWVNIDQVDEEALTYLRTKHNFHHLDLEDVQGESQTPKLDTYNNYLFLIVQYPHWNPNLKQVVAYELNIFIGEGYLITIQHTKSKEMKDFFYRCMKNKTIRKDWMSRTSGYLLYRLLESFFKNSRPMLNRIGKELLIIEDNIFEQQPTAQTVRQLAVHRRANLNFRRIIDPQRYLIANLSHIRKPFLNEETSLYFDDISDYLTKTWAVADTYRDTINGLHVTVESLLAQRTNRVIGVLTVISVGLLPFTVLASIYGMNVESLPFADNPVAVWSMFGVLAVIIIGLMITMRNKL